MDAALPSDPAILFEPLRLGFVSDVGTRAATEPGCSDRVEITGTLTAMGPGAPMQLTPVVPLRRVRTNKGGAGLTFGGIF